MYISCYCQMNMTRKWSFSFCLYNLPIIHKLYHAGLTAFSMTATDSNLYVHPYVLPLIRRASNLHSFRAWSFRSPSLWPLRFTVLWPPTSHNPKTAHHSSVIHPNYFNKAKNLRGWMSSFSNFIFRRRWLYLRGDFSQLFKYFFCPNHSHTCI